MFPIVWLTRARKVFYVVPALLVLAGTMPAYATSAQRDGAQLALVPIFQTSALHAAASTPTPTTNADSETFGGGGNNEVKVTNQTDNKLAVKGRIQVNHISSSNASPQNQAYAYSSCTDCQTFAVALQINLIGTSTTNVRPQNAAIALNYMCTRCTTVARALQYNISEADPRQTASDIKALVREMNSELKSIEKDRSITLDQARLGINRVIDQFQTLGHYLSTKRQVDTSTTNPKAKPLPGATPTVTATPTPAP